MSITNTSFSLKPLSEGYELTIDFAKKNRLVSQKHFTFAERAQSLKQEEFLDVYSQNGTCSQVLDTLFQADDISVMETIMTSSLPKGPTVLVLDLKDETAKYCGGVEGHRRSHSTIGTARL